MPILFKGRAHGAARGGAVPEQGLPRVGGERYDPRPVTASAIQQARRLELRSSGAALSRACCCGWFRLVFAFLLWFRRCACRISTELTFVLSSPSPCVLSVNINFQTVDRPVSETILDTLPSPRAS